MKAAFMLSNGAWYIDSVQRISCKNWLSCCLSSSWILMGHMALVWQENNKKQISKNHIQIKMEESKTKYITLW